MSSARFSRWLKPAAAACAIAASGCKPNPSAQFESLSGRLGDDQISSKYAAALQNTHFEPAFSNVAAATPESDGWTQVFAGFGCADSLPDARNELVPFPAAKAADINGESVNDKYYEFTINQKWPQGGPGAMRPAVTRVMRCNYVSELIWQVGLTKNKEIKLNKGLDLPNIGRFQRARTPANVSELGQLLAQNFKCFGALTGQLEERQDSFVYSQVCAAHAGIAEHPKQLGIWGVSFEVAKESGQISVHRSGIFRTIDVSAGLPKTVEK